MPEDNLLEARGKIVSILQAKGPSLPVQIARETQINSLFAGALLSELASEKKIKISNMKVGGSPLYYLQGQEPKLEEFYKYLPGKEREAFLLLKEKKVLEDKTQQPAIRVALRNLKDFSFPFSKDNEVWWRFHTTTEQEVRNILEPKKEVKKEPEGKKEELKTEIKEEPKREIKEEPKKEVKKELPKPKIKQEERKLIKEKQEIKKEPKKEVQKLPKKTEKQLDIGLKSAVNKIVRTVKNVVKERPDFAIKITEILKNNSIEVLEEKEAKKREFSCIIRINSDLGKIKFFCIAKDKKSITENDLKLILQSSQSLKMPVLVLFSGEVNKKASEFAESCPLLKLKKIK